MRSSRGILCASLIWVVLTGILALSSGWAYEPINANSRGVAIEGYDPVAYFTQGKAVKGSEDYAYTWMGAQWHFSSKEHLEVFKSNPEKYAPRYGGY